ncbi:hypothetical protein Pcinc_042456 [Petrolisthes cinctipes]|uniref:Uncharacterized protein n=1 Tax=Petrolisthes cinctipes TaxID=88211 RepID=A0AAE1EHC5_PETCI|nr:hypothetical protein Pcinc_042456 [Petrolisthes cinctipes]
MRMMHPHSHQLKKEKGGYGSWVSVSPIPERPHALTCAPHLPRIPCIPVSFTLHIPRLHNGGQKRACVGMKEARAKRGKGLAGWREGERRKKRVLLEGGREGREGKRRKKRVWLEGGREREGRRGHGWREGGRERGKGGREKEEEGMAGGRQGEKEGEGMLGGGKREEKHLAGKRRDIERGEG